MGKARKSKTKKKGFWSSIIQGRILSVGVFKKYWAAVALCIIMVLAHNASKYKCQTQIAEIEKLKNDLSNAQTANVEASSRYNTLIRESNLTKLVDTMRLNLKMTERPPYSVTD